MESTPPPGSSRQAAVLEENARLRAQLDILVTQLRAAERRQAETPSELLPTYEEARANDTP